MKKLTLIIYLVLTVAITIIAQPNDFPKLTGPYLGQKPPGPMPEIFAPGILSRFSMLHGKIAFSPDGLEAFWTCNAAPVQSRWTARQTPHGIWAAPEPAFLSVEYVENSMYYSADGKRLYFHSRRPLQGIDSPKDKDIWYREKKAEGWAEPIPLGPPVNQAATEESAPSLAADGTLFFSRQDSAAAHGAPGHGAGQIDIFYSEWKNGAYAEPVRMGPEINSEYLEIDPVIAPNKSYLLFTSDRPDGYSRMMNLYVSFRLADGRWTPAQSLSDTLKIDNIWFPSLSADGAYLFFCGGYPTDKGYTDSQYYWVSAKIIEELRPKKYTPLPVMGLEKSLLTTEEWLEDLDFVVSTLKSQHPNIYYKINTTKFDSVVAESRSQIARSKSDLECYFAIKTIIAVIEDGHTGLLEDGIFNLLDLRFPFRVDEFTDGVYITLIRKENEVFLGSRITAVNGQPIENVLATIEKVISSDNRFGRRFWALSGISFARVLHGLRIIDNTDEIELALILQNGNSAKLALPSMRDDSPIEYGWSNRLNIGPTKGEYISPSDKLGETIPSYFKNQGKKIKYYWFEHLVNDRTIYFQFNQVSNQPDNDETFAQFSARMWNYIDQNAGNIDKLVIDLRQNNGGNGVLILPFLNQIIKRDYINKEGSLFVISGKRTYSAAPVFMNELAVHTNVRFIGEPDGCGSDLFSNNRLAGRLPHSGFPLWIARLHFTSRWPGNNAEYFMPHFPAPFSSHDYFNGHDPALELALKGGFQSVAEYAADKGADAALIYYRQQKEKYKGLDWWTALNPEKLERDVNRKGYDLMANSDLKRALRVFTLNTLLFPKSSNAWDSLGECAYNMKEFDLALQFYSKSIELNPDNVAGEKMLERIKAVLKKK